MDISAAEAIDGWMSGVELDWLAQQAQDKKLIIELGAWKGRSTKALATYTPGTVFAIDHWMGTESERTHSHKEAADLGPDAFFDIFLKNLYQEISEGKVIPIRQDTTIAASIVETLLDGKLVDMLFIDADHSYAAVSTDLAMYTRYVKPGGLICGHDYTSHADVKRAVDEYCTPNLGHGAIWWTTK